MAQGDGSIYNTFKEKVMEGTHNLATGGNTIKFALLGTYTLNLAHANYGDVSGTEYNTGAGYTSGGETLTGQDVVSNGITGTFDGTDVTFTSLGPLSPSHPTHTVAYNNTASGKPLIAAWEVSGTAPNGGNWTLQFGVNGIITLT